jgi:hypothetical protein
VKKIKNGNIGAFLALIEENNEGEIILPYSMFLLLVGQIFIYG